MNVDIIAAIIGGVSAIITVIVDRWIEKHKIDAEKGKNDADAAKSITAAATELIAPLTTRIDEQDQKLIAQDKKITDQEGEIAYLRKKVDSFLMGIRKLIEQIKCLGQDPVWTPDEASPRADRSKR